MKAEALLQVSFSSGTEECRGDTVVEGDQTHQMTLTGVYGPTMPGCNGYHWAKSIRSQDGASLRKFYQDVVSLGNVCQDGTSLSGKV